MTAPKGPVAKETPAGALAFGKAATPSACEPERKKAVSVAAVAGAQPAELETNVAPAEQFAQPGPP